MVMIFASISIVITSRYGRTRDYAYAYVWFSLPRADAARGQPQGLLDAHIAAARIPPPPVTEGRRRVAAWRRTSNLERKPENLRT